MLKKHCSKKHCSKKTQSHPGQTLSLLIKGSHRNHTRPSESYTQQQQPKMEYTNQNNNNALFTTATITTLWLCFPFITLIKMILPTNNGPHHLFRWHYPLLVKQATVVFHSCTSCNYTFCMFSCNNNSCIIHFTHSHNSLVKPTTTTKIKIKTKIKNKNKNQDINSNSNNNHNVF